MPVTQREWDVMQLESEQKIRDIYEEWKRSFFKGRIPASSQASSVAELPPSPEVESY